MTRPPMRPTAFAAADTKLACRVCRAWRVKAFEAEETFLVRVVRAHSSALVASVRCIAAACDLEADAKAERTL